MMNWREEERQVADARKQRALLEKYPNGYDARLRKAVLEPKQYTAEYKPVQAPDSLKACVVDPANTALDKSILRCRAGTVQGWLDANEAENALLFGPKVVLNPVVAEGD